MHKGNIMTAVIQKEENKKYITITDKLLVYIGKIKKGKLKNWEVLPAETVD
jgi:hypothetical protein